MRETRRRARFASSKLTFGALGRTQGLLSFLLEAGRHDGDRLPAPAGLDARVYAPGETPERIAAENERLAKQIAAHPAPKA